MLRHHALRLAGAFALLASGCSLVVGDDTTCSSDADCTAGARCHEGVCQQPGQDGGPVDVTPPTVTITAKPADPSDTGDARFEFACSEAICTFECDLDSAGFAACSSPNDYAALRDGSHTFQVRATDAAHNVGVPASFTWVVDASLPDTSITGTTPLDPTNATTASFEFSCTQPPCTFECSMDSAVFTTCVSGQSYASLGDGAHLFQVRARNDRNRADPTPASFTWTVDLIPPNTTVSPTPSTSPTTSTSESFSLACTEPSCTFECSLDGADFSACTSPHVVAGLGDGSHAFEAHGIDAAGNPDPSPARYTWVVDATPPETELTAGSLPANPTNSTLGGAAFTCTDASTPCTFECRFDGGGFSSCMSPVVFIDLADGSHTFEVRATDALGLVDASPAAYTWVVNTTLPVAEFQSHPNAATNLVAAQFVFAAGASVCPTGACTYECSLDGAAFALCTSPKDVTASASNQPHSFAVRATLVSTGTVGPTATWSWYVDQTPPTTFLDTKPADPTKLDSANFTFHCSDNIASLPCTFVCTLDKGTANESVAACNTQPKSYAGLASGNHTFEVLATDAAGNASASAPSFAWRVDRDPPVTTIDMMPADPSNDPRPAFAFHCTDASLPCSFECDIDGFAIVPCSAAGATPSGDLSNGSHTFHVTATDAVGNIESPASSFTWRVDLIVPTASIVPPTPSNLTNATTADFTVNCSESPCTLECKLDTSGFSTCPSPLHYSSLGDGAHSFEVRARDPAGNVQTTPASFSWTVDATRPVTSFDTGGTPQNPSSDASPTFRFSCADASTPCVYECRAYLVGTSPLPAFAGCTTTNPVSAVPDGDWVFETRATDQAGNVEETPLVFSWTVDTANPVVTLSGTPASASTVESRAASFTFGCTDATGCTLECRLDAGAFASCTSPVTYSLLGEGAHTFYVRATDALSHQATSPHGWTVDTAPVTTIVTHPANPTTSTTAAFTFSASEAGCSFECDWDDAGIFSPCDPAATTHPADPSVPAGLHVLRVQARDAGGKVEKTPVRFDWVVSASWIPTGVSAGREATCAVTSTGGVKCWGSDFLGKLGDADAFTRTKGAPVDVAGVSTASAVSIGGDRACALTAGDGVVCWGSGGASTPVADGSSATAVTVGDRFACAIVAGAAQCWGLNNVGQLGDGTNTTSASPVAVSGLASGVTAIAAGAEHACAVMGGAVWCWGFGDLGQLGDGTATTSNVPVDTGLTGATRVAAGYAHSCALVGGGVKCWGNDTAGQLGNGLPLTLSSTPVDVTGLSSGVTGIAAGGENTCANVGGAAKCWGRNGHGQVGDGAQAVRSVPADVSGLTSGVQAIEVGVGHACALVTSGPDTLLRCWGDNGFGQLGGGAIAHRPQPAALGGLTAALGPSAGAFLTCARVGAGLECWGEGTLGQVGDGASLSRKAPAVVSPLSGTITSISAGGASTGAHACAVAGGGVSCWGYNSFGQLGDNTTTGKPSPVAVSGLSSTVTLIAAGGRHTCAVHGGAAKCWGANDTEQLGNAAAPGLSMLAVQVDGLASGVVAVSAGVGFSCALMAGGGVKCWGDNSTSQLGNGTTGGSSAAPGDVSGLTSGVAQISSGSTHSCARLSSGQVRCWGDNGSGQLGDGSVAARTAPVAVDLPTSAVAVAAGGDSSCAALDSGRVHCWGKNEGSATSPGWSTLVRGLLGGGCATTACSTPADVPGITEAVDVTVGIDHACARLQSGAVLCWGLGDHGQLGLGDAWATSSQAVFATP